jgi:hypothetical protein
MTSNYTEEKRVSSELFGDISLQEEEGKHFPPVEVKTFTIMTNSESSGDSDNDSDSGRICYDRHEFDFSHWQEQALARAQAKIQAQTHHARDKDATLKYHNLINAHAKQQDGSDMQSDNNTTITYITV